MKNLFKILLAFFLLPVSIALAAVGYDGTGDSHEIDNPNKGAITAFTVCGWFYTATWQDEAVIASYGNHSSTTAGRGWQISTRDDGRFRIGVFYGSTTQVLDETATGLATSTWHHWCYVHTASRDSLYVNASDATEDDFDDLDNNVAQDSTDDFFVAQKVGSGIKPNVAGREAHVAYWNTDLSGAQIASIADKSTCPTAVAGANLQVFLTLDAAGSVVDTSSNAFSVVENGNPTTQTGPTGLPCSGGGGADLLPRLQAIGED